MARSEPSPFTTASPARPGIHDETAEAALVQPTDDQLYGLTDDEIAGLGVALNEATVLDAEVLPQERVAHTLKTGKPLRN